MRDGLHGGGRPQQGGGSVAAEGGARSSAPPGPRPRAAFGVPVPPLEIMAGIAVLLAGTPGEAVEALADELAELDDGFTLTWLGRAFIVDAEGLGVWWENGMFEDMTVLAASAVAMVVRGEV